MTNINRGASLATQNSVIMASYTFVPASGLVSIANKKYIILSIINLTSSDVLYNPLTSIGGTLEVPGTVNVDRDTSMMSSTDDLLIVADTGTSDLISIFLENILEELQVQTEFLQEIVSR